MTLNLRMPEMEDLKPRLTVFGIGGAGGNAVNNMIDKALEGVDFVVANTDAQALGATKATSKVQLGAKITEGLGAGARPTVGAAAAEESIEDIVDHLVGSHMCFITAGMGGGTGTGGAPIVAQAAREMGILTVGVVTKPFQFEGSRRMRQAEEGVEALQKVVDTLIIIPNQNLFRIANENTTFTEAFSLADDVLYQGVKGVTDLMVRPGIINLDFADIRSVMDEMGKAMMGTGEAEGESRAIQAAEKAIANPLLDEISLRGAKGVLINITGGQDLTLFELDEAANRIREEVDPEANIIVGSTLDSGMENKMRVSVVATGIDALEGARDIPLPRRSLKEPLAASPALEAETAEVAPQTPTPTEPAYEEQAAAAPEPQATPEHHAAQPEPNLFSELPISPAPAPAPSPTLGADPFAAPQADDSLPPPAYQPQVPQASLEAEPLAEEDPTEFVAPQGARPGQPSVETMARLQAAVSNAPKSTPQPVEQPEFFAGDSQESQQKGFRLNSLISRMTGSDDQSSQSTATRSQPPVTGSDTAPTAPGHETPDSNEGVEIPAFLRRQAN